MTTPCASLSKRGEYTLNYEDFLLNYLRQSSANEFHFEKNPKGIINFGTAMNKLMEDELEERLSRSDVFKFRSSMHQNYFEFHGKFALRTVLADFFMRYFNATEPVSPENLIVMSGSASCLDSLSFALFDPGDIYITPTPAYGRIFTDMNNRSLAQPVPLELTSKPDEDGKLFTLTAQLLEDRILGLRSQGKIVKGFVLINPQNPLGDVYPRELLMSLLDVCAKYQLHAIFDEVYALSRFDPDAEVNSVLSVSNIPDPQRTHFVWALSKDFGLAGARVGVIHTKNQDAIKVLRDISVYCPTASIIQDMATEILKDTKWLDEIYLPLYRQRLRETYHMVKNRLEGLGIPVRPAEAGLFIWFSLKDFLKTNSHEDEMELFKAIFDGGVYVVPGSQLYCDDPGWFRMVFAASKGELEIGLYRLETILKERKLL